MKREDAHEKVEVRSTSWRSFNQGESIVCFTKRKLQLGTCREEFEESKTYIYSFIPFLIEKGADPNLIDICNNHIPTPPRFHRLIPFYHTVCNIEVDIMYLLSIQVILILFIYKCRISVLELYILWCYSELTLITCIVFLYFECSLTAQQDQLKCVDF